MTVTPDRYYKVDVLFWHKNTCQRLKDAFGFAGPCVWLSLIAEAKKHQPPGRFTWTSEADAWRQLGFHEDTMPFTFAAFLELTGRLKQTRVAKTSRTGRGHVANVELTRYAQWQRDWRRETSRDRQNRWRTQETGRDTKRDETRDNQRDTSVTEVLGSSTSKPPTPFYKENPRPNGTVDFHKAAQGFITGHGWDPEATSEEAIRDELATIARKTRNEPPDHELGALLEQWRTLRDQRLAEDAAGRLP